MNKFKHGDIIRFTYVNPKKQSGDMTIFKEVFVLNPMWEGKVHAIDLKRLTVAERYVIKTMMRPGAEKKVHRIPLINDILKRIDPPELVRNPIGFYNQFVKTFLKNKDAYRTYFPSLMTGIQVIDASEVKSAVPSAGESKPLFGN